MEAIYRIAYVFRRVTNYNCVQFSVKHFSIYREVGKSLQQDAFFFRLLIFLAQSSAFRTANLLNSVLISTKASNASMPQTSPLVISFEDFGNRNARGKNGCFYTGGRLSVQTDNLSMAVFILRTHYPTAPTWANICSSSGYASQV